MVLDYNIKTQRTVLTDNIVKSILTDYKRGETRRYICNKYKISSGTLYRLLDKNDTPRRIKESGRTQTILDQYSGTLKKMIHGGYHEGIDTNLLKKQYGVNKNALYVIIDQVSSNERQVQAGRDNETIKKLNTQVVY